FFPITCGGIDLAAIKKDRDQLWAEAFTMYRAGLQWGLAEQETALAVKEQEARLEMDEWREPIEKHLENKDQITIGEILSHVFGLDGAKGDQRSQNRGRWGGSDVSVVSKVERPGCMSNRTGETGDTELVASLADS